MLVIEELVQVIIKFFYIRHYLNGNILNKKELKFLSYRKELKPNELILDILLFPLVTVLIWDNQMGPLLTSPLTLLHSHTL